MNKHEVHKAFIQQQIEDLENGNIQEIDKGTQFIAWLWLILTAILAGSVLLGLVLPQMGMD